MHAHKYNYSLGSQLGRRARILSTFQVTARIYPLHGLCEQYYGGSLQTNGAKLPREPI